MLYMASFINYTTIIDLSPESLAILNEPTVINIADPLGTIYNIALYFAKWFVLIQISTEFQLIALILTPFTIITLYLILKTILEAIPFT